LPRGSSSQADTDHGRPHTRRTTAWPCWQNTSTAPVGVDTHRDTLAAAAVTTLGGVLAHTTTSADAGGYRRLLDFAHAHLPGRRLWAVEGTGSFGAGLAGFLQQRGEDVVEVGRPKRPASRSGAKSDALDAVRTRPRGARPRPPGDPAASR
jgi:transposase